MAKGRKDDLDDIPHNRKEPRPDFNAPPAAKKLPQSIQDTLNDDDKLWELIYEGKAKESTESNIRYAAYASRIRTILLSAHRYVAYTSDIGESFRPVAHPWLVRGAYGISWAYLAGDVAHEGYKAYLHNQATLHPEKSISGTPVTSSVGYASGTQPQHRSLGPGMTAPKVPTPTEPGRVPAIEDYRTVMVQRAIFQGLASMGLPAFTIHSVVKYSGRALKDVKNTRIRTYGPIGLGLAIVPFLPFIFDEPVEKAVEWTFHQAFEKLGGPQAVGGGPVAGEHVPRRADARGNAAKEKEL